MSKINDGGPAFPASEGEAHQIAYAEMMASGAATSEEKDAVYMAAKAAALRGMSLRDYFAAKAMQGAMVNARLPGLDDGDPDAITLLSKACEVVYIVADAMLKARENNT